MTQPEKPRILKADALRELGVKVAFNFGDFNENCDAHLDRVRKTAAEILRQASAEADGIRQAAWEEGYQEGHRQGTEEAAATAAKHIATEAATRTQKSLHQALPALKQVAVALQSERDLWMTAWETLGVTLAVNIAQKILGREIEARPGLGVRSMKSLLKMVVGQPQIEVYLHPDDLTVLQQHQTDISKTAGQLGDVTVIADDTMAAGGCVVKTRVGELDARIESQLERITAELLQADTGDDNE